MLKTLSIDLKITNCCDMNCAFCHEDSKKDGKHGDILTLKFLDTLLPFTELAIGGGNPLEHPDLMMFLRKCKNRNLICNITLNQVHFLHNVELLKKLIKEKLIYGVGVSLTSPTTELINTLKEFDNAVVHVINGIHSINDLKKLYDNDLKMLILGYKQFRRGEAYYSKKVEKTKEELYEKLPEIIPHFKVVSFDNIALSQLECKRLVSEEEWETYYIGEDRQFTMYIDCVNKTFASSSVSVARFSLSDDIKEMFSTILKC